MANEHPFYLAGQWHRSADVLPVTNPWDGSVIGLDLAGQRGPGRRGDSRRRRRGRHDAQPAGVRAGRHSRESLVGAEPPADGNRPRPRRRSGQAHQRRAHRSRSRRHDVSRRERRSAPHRRRRDPAGSRPARQGPHRHRAPLPHRARSRPSRRSTSRSTSRRTSWLPPSRPATPSCSSRPPRRRSRRCSSPARSKRPGLPKGALSVLPMSRQLGDRLVTDERFKLLTFTGSSAVGWAMKARAGKKKVILELGGNAGVIVDESADVDWAAKRVGDRRLRVRGPELHLRPARVRARARLRRLRHAASSRASSRSSSATRSTARPTSGR